MIDHKAPLTDHEALHQDSYHLCPASLETLVAHATTARDEVCAMTHAWVATYHAGDCSPRQIVAALYTYHQPLHDAIALLEQAKQDCRQALQRPLLALVAPVELPGQATLRWVAPTHTVSYAPKTVAAITTDLNADLLPLLPSLASLGTLLPLLTTAQSQGALSAADTEALITTINDLACGCRAAQNAARRLRDARTEGSRAGYTKIEACRSTPPDAQIG